MTGRRSTSLIAAAATTVASFALAACGGGSPEEGAAAAGRQGQQAQFRELAAKHAKCMRENGVDVPDPKPGQAGIMIGGPDSEADPATMRRAERRCRKLLKELPEPPQLSEEDEREFKESALEHARCMRAQGVDFPDPTFGSGGRVQMRLPEGVRPDDPSFKAAERKCRKTRPGGGVRFGAPGE